MAIRNNLVITEETVAQLLKLIKKAPNNAAKYVSAASWESDSTGYGWDRRHSLELGATAIEALPALLAAAEEKLNSLDSENDKTSRVLHKILASIREPTDEMLQAAHRVPIHAGDMTSDRFRAMIDVVIATTKDNAMENRQTPVTSLPEYDDEVSKEYLDMMQARVDAEKPGNFRLSEIDFPDTEEGWQARAEHAERRKPWTLKRAAVIAAVPFFSAYLLFTGRKTNG